MATDPQAGLSRLLLKEEIEEFFAAEADCLDERRFDDWLSLLTEDIRYWMPMARNVPTEDLAREYTAEGMDANWIDEGIETLRQRVKQLATGIHWAEQPPSRTTHMISNLRVMTATPENAVQDVSATLEAATRCRFLVYRNRNEDEQDVFVGKRNDTVRRIGGAWRLARREILLDQNVMLSKNISIFL